MSNAASVFARWRVRLGYILAVFVLWFARPTPGYVVIGAGIGLIGLWKRDIGTRCWCRDALVDFWSDTSSLFCRGL